MIAVLEAREPSAKYLAQVQPTLVQQFELMATAPGGVARLRELILTLAVQGKLVPQASDDGGASALLEQVRTERSRLVLNQNFKRTKAQVAATLENLPCCLPSGWEWVSLANLGEFHGGKTPSTQQANFWDGSIPWITPKDMKKLRLNDSEDKVTQAGVANGLSLIPPNSVLIVVRSGILRRTVPTAINEVETTVNQDLKALVLVLSQLAGYVQLMIRGFERFILSHLTKVGTTVESIQFDAFASQCFPLPPLAEQTRIVARVEELMRLCDALDTQGQLEAAQHAQLVGTLLGTLTDSANADELAANWQRVATHFDTLLDRPEAIDALEQTILQLAVRGLLVPQDPNDEPASVLLQKIRAQKDRLIAEGKLRRERAALLMAEPSQPFELPARWEWVSINDVATVGTGTTPLRDNPAFFASGSIPWVTSGETSQTVIDSTAQHVTEAALSQTSLTVYPVGTLIMAMYGQGKTRGQISELAIPAATNQACAAITLIDPSMSHRRFVKLVFEMSYDEIRELSAGGAQPNLNVGKVKQSRIPLPPLAEQARIVVRVDQLRRLSADLRKRLTARQTTQSHLAQALVESATT